jgi:cation diffusion facilitator CzcD-associated flavoprotein CzcO
MSIAQTQTGSAMDRHEETPVDSRADRFCILGAGSSGLAVAKNFREMGVPYDCLERGDDIGGNWRYGSSLSRVYQSTRLISSKRLTEYTDFPMPDDYPEHPSHELVFRYLRDYATRFGIYNDIQFGTGIRWAEPLAGGGWLVTLDSGDQRQYRGIVIANGHNWDPRWPTYPGEFAGTVLHSADYKSSSMLAGRRVLVVGGGNSGCDIAVESAGHASATFHSMRRNYQFLPRYYRGKPIDQCGEGLLRWRVPVRWRRWAARRIARRVFGESAIAQAADHKFLETHPIINAWHPHMVRSGSIGLKPDVAELKTDRVRFVDGSEEPIDLILFATGYKLSFPFLDSKYLNWQEGRPRLYLNLFHPERDDLFVVGMIQPDSGQFGLVDYQAQAVGRFLIAMAQGRKVANQLQQEKRQRRPELSGGIRYVDSPRHSLEVEHFSYRRTLQKWIRRLAK